MAVVIELRSPPASEVSEIDSTPDVVHSDLPNGLACFFEASERAKTLNLIANRSDFL